MMCDRKTEGVYSSSVTVYSSSVMCIDVSVNNQVVNEVVNEVDNQVVNEVENEVENDIEENEYDEDYYIHEYPWVDSRRRITKLGLVTALVQVNMLNIGILLARFYLDHDIARHDIARHDIRHNKSFSYHWYLIQHLVHCITYLCFMQFGVVNSPKTLRTLIQQGYAVAFVIQVLVWCVLCINMVLDKNNLRWFNTV